MARKKAQKKKPDTTLVPHRTPNLSALLERAKSGDSARAVKSYLDAGGSAGAHVLTFEASSVEQQMPLLHHMALHHSHPHTELAECVRLLIDAGADINATDRDNHYTALMCASAAGCCTTVLQILLQHGADVLVATPYGETAISKAY